MPRMRIDGFDQFVEQLRKLPVHLRDEAATIVASTTNEAAREIVDKYPTVTGNLKDGVKVRALSAGPYGARYEVRSGAPHAHLYEFGTSGGAGRGHNQPPHATVIPVAVRRRRTMYERLKTMLRREGFQVTGDVR